jgi:hypothetical protein
MVHFNTVLNTTIYNHLIGVYILSHGNMFWLCIQPSSGLKEICPGTKDVYTFFVPGQIFLRPDDG